MRSLRQRKRGERARPKTVSSARANIDHTSQLFDPGYYRIHLQTKDGDSLTVFAPLDSQGSYGLGPVPHLIKIVEHGNEYVAEFVVDPGKWNRIVWHGIDSADYLTDLLKRNLRVGQQVIVYEGDTTCDRRVYFARDIRRL